MTPPVDVGEGLVVEGEAAEENLGAGLDFGSFSVPLYGLGIVIHTRVIWHLQRVHEGLLAGVKDGLEVGDVGVAEAAEFGFDGAVNIANGILNIVSVRLIRILV
ncbi:DNA internalization-related competence protein ComEC/Rec2 [Babesia caballi]|uniref:DNA internalization-related competence protein ComEC/Rec2 n=1 Tax=Babesia caballi TaxID=5871 RepID=A0AAV4LTJ6_BABCB|nr:DNA internalization-related competence protein ComEC/Rec2 [Babesia caballi]